MTSQLLLRLAACTTLGLAATASQAQVNAAFQVTSFSYTVSAGTLSWLPGAAYQTQAVESAEAGGLGGNDWDSATLFTLQNNTLSTGVAHASASSTAGANGTLSGLVAALPSFVADTANPHFGTAMTQQSNEFSLSEAGSVTFTVTYQLSVGANPGDALYSYGQSSLDFAAGNYDNNSGGTQFAELLSFDQPGNAGAQSGSFTLTVLLGGPGDIGFYNLRGNAFASATAAVPEAGTWALMLLGLAGVGALARRQRTC